MQMKSGSKQDVRDARLAEEDLPILSSIDAILTDVQAGKPVIIVDDEGRENEGDLIVAAEKAGPDVINFLARFGRGLICLPMEAAMVDRLGLQLMGRGNNTHHRTAFTVSIEAREGVTTGISAADRARTVAVAIDPESGPNDVATPGHVFPLRAQDGGVLVRAGHTEAAVDLARMAGFSGAGVICEIMNDDGSMARLPDLVAFAQFHGLKIGAIADLIAYRRRHEKLVERIYEGVFTSRYGGDFNLCLYTNAVQYAEHVVLVKGDIDAASDEPVLVRMHALDVLSDVLGGGDASLQRSMEIIGEEGYGIVVLLREPNARRLSQKVMNMGAGMVHEPSGRLLEYGIGAQILADLGVGRMILLTDHPKSVPGLEAYGLEIAGYRSLKPEGGNA